MANPEHVEYVHQNPGFGNTWRKWNRLIHRDLGFLCVGLTVIYAVSGVAVNHVGDWNPNYIVTETPGNVGPVTAENPGSPEVVRGILSALELGNEYRGIFRRNQATLVIFLDGGRVSVDLPTGNAVVDTARNVPCSASCIFTGTSLNPR